MEDSDSVQSYCVWCKGKHIMQNATLIRARHGRMTLTGNCVRCGKKMFAMEASSLDPVPIAQDWQADGICRPTMIAAAYYSLGNAPFAGRRVPR